MLKRRISLHIARPMVIAVAFLCALFLSQPAFAAEENSDASQESSSTSVDAATELDQTAQTGDATTSNNSVVQEEAPTEQPGSTGGQEDGQTPGDEPSENAQSEACSPAENVPADRPAETSPSEQPDATNDVSIGNNVCSTADSGDAQVSGDQTSGDATSGQATAQATIINQIQTLTGLNEAEIATFIQDIYSDVYGDVMIDPRTLNYLLSQACSGICDPSYGLNVVNNLGIDNDVYLSAASGDAQVNGDHTSGSATTGDASVVLNLINIINSIISGGQSFVGTINIYGNLDGDILLPPDVLAGLLSSDSAPGGSSLGSYSQTTNVSISNNVFMSAVTGSAEVSGQAATGDATSGAAVNNVIIHNLVNSLTIGNQALLVFVNVLGTWTGLIVNSPAGATSAMLGGIGQGEPCNNCALAGISQISNNFSINNNIYLSATSGNAAVLGSHTTGSASSGEASTYLNLINIVNSNLVFSDWFGVLFINVFGSWNGSFGIDTMAGEPPLSDQGKTEPDSSPTTKVKNPAFVFASAISSPILSNTDSGEQPYQSVNSGSSLSAMNETVNPSANRDYSTWLAILLAAILLGSLSTRRVNGQKT